LRPPHYKHPSFHALTMDFRDPKMTDLLSVHDALIHLAYVVLRGHTAESEMRAVNVEDSMALLLRARQGGLRRVIHLSSAAVYGSGTHLDESARLAPLPSFLYGQHKAELERRLEEEFPDSLRLRPHVILGPHAQPTLRQLLELPFYLSVPDPQPQLQCVHEIDVANAILLGLNCNVGGAFNLAATDTFSLREVKRERNPICLPLPVSAARVALHAVHRLSGWGGEPGWLDGLQHSLTLDCRRAAAELQWRPTYSTAQTIAETR